MALFEWSNSLSVGNRFIDEDHKKLITMVNAFHDAMEQGKGNDVIGKVLRNLILYTGEHFGREELEMRRIGYARYLTHKMEHDKLIAQVESLQKSIESGQSMLTLKVSKFLKDWLVTHIQQTDQLLANALKQTQTVSTSA